MARITEKSAMHVFLLTEYEFIRTSSRKIVTTKEVVSCQ